MEGSIHVDSLGKTYQIPLREPGIAAALASLIRPTYAEVTAVRDVSFAVQSGEMVGLLGPNGSGKTTTLKMLAGLLYPTSGKVEVAGSVPQQRKPEFLRSISLVMGNKTQLTWDNTVHDSFLIHKEIYGVSQGAFRTRLGELTEMLDLAALLPKQTRNLSLGERAKCQLVLALLHNPRILFLDEPTLGLDVSMQIRFRSFLKEYNHRHGTTVILTSHYMADITSLCRRVILINKGTVFYDGDLSEMARRTAPFKLVRITNQGDLSGPEQTHLRELLERLHIVEQEQRNVTFRVERSQVVPLLGPLLNAGSMADVSIFDPPIEAVIDTLYQGVMA